MYKNYKENEKQLNAEIEKLFGNNTHYYITCSNPKRYIKEICELFPNIVILKYYNKIYLKNNISIIFTSNVVGARPLIDYVDLKKILIYYSRLDYERHLLYLKFLLHTERQRNIDLLFTSKNLTFIKEKAIIKSYRKNKEVLENLEEWLKDMIEPKPLKDGGIGYVQSISPHVVLDMILESKEEKE